MTTAATATAASAAAVMTIAMGRAARDTLPILPDPAAFRHGASPEVA
jgi:hypothetical protein